MTDSSAPRAESGRQGAPRDAEARLRAHFGAPNVQARLPSRAHSGASEEHSMLLVSGVVAVESPSERLYAREVQESACVLVFHSHVEEGGAHGLVSGWLGDGDRASPGCSEGSSPQLERPAWLQGTRGATGARSHASVDARTPASSRPQTPTPASATMMFDTAEEDSACLQSESDDSERPARSAGNRSARRAYSA